MAGRKASTQEPNEQQLGAPVPRNPTLVVEEQEPNEQQLGAPVPRDLTLVVEEANKQMESVIICCCRSVTKFVSDSFVTNGL